MRYVARRAMNLGDRWVEPGDEVPEAADWPVSVRRPCIPDFLTELPDEPAPPKGATPDGSEGQADQGQRRGRSQRRR